MSLLLRRRGFYVNIFVRIDTVERYSLPFFLGRGFFFGFRRPVTLCHLVMVWTSCRLSVNAPVSLTRASERDVVRSKLAIRMSKIKREVSL